MKIKKIICIVLVLSALLTFLLSFYLINNCQDRFENITQLNYNYNSKIKPLTISDTQKIIKTINNVSVNILTLSFCSELEQSSIKGATVTPVLTNKIYFKNYCVKTKNFKKNSIVISKDLALKLFFNTDVEGKKIMLNNMQFTISGIYNNRNNFINKLSDDQNERVYIFYKSIKDYKSKTVQEFSYMNGTQSAATMEQLSLDGYYAADFSGKSKVIKNFAHIIFLIIYTAFLIFGIKLWIYICRKKFYNIRENFKDNYFLQSIKSAPADYIILLLAGLGIPIILISVFLYCDFSIFIISKYIPYDNIFDVQFYINAVLQNSQEINSLALSGNTFLNNLYLCSFTHLIFLTVIFLILFTTSILSVYNLIKTQTKRGT